MASDIVTGTSDAGERALALMDKLLAERPEKVSHDFSETTRCLTALRDELIGRVRQGAARRELDVANSVLSVVVGGYFPLGGVPWPQIEAARNRLAEIVPSTPR